MTAVTIPQSYGRPWSHVEFPGRQDSLEVRPPSQLSALLTCSHAYGCVLFLHAVKVAQLIAVNNSGVQRCPQHLKVLPAARDAVGDGTPEGTSITQAP